MSESREASATTPILRGILPIAPTPFDEGGRIDVPSIRTLTRFMVDCGVHGLVVLGVMGEVHAMTDAERDEVVAAFREALPRDRQLVVGVLGDSAWTAAAAADRAAALGADAMMVGPPPVQNDEVVAAHFAQVGKTSSLPVVVHDYPAATRVVLSPSLLARLHREIPAVRYVKLEDPPTGPKIARVQQLAGDGFGVFGALGGMYALEELERGAIGIMTGFAFPELLVRLYDLHQRGDAAASAELFYGILPLVRFEFQPGLGVGLRKELLRRRGVIRTAVVRPPAATPDEVTRRQLDRILDFLIVRGLLPAAHSHT